MVLLHVKRSDKDSFLFDTPAASEVEATLRALLEDYDVSKGEVVPHAPPKHGANYRQDPSERRTGDCPSDELAQVIQKTVEDAKALTHEKTTVALKRSTNSA